jgi:hypothetical protein
MNIPQTTLIVPVRRRLQFTTNVLPSFLQHSARRDHEVLLVIDECPASYEEDRRGTGAVNFNEDEAGRWLVEQWLRTHQTLLSESNIRVLRSRGNPRCWTGGLRCAAAMNLGLEVARTEWVLGIGDEDLVFMPEWDRHLFDALDGHNPEKTVAVPVMVTPEVRAGWPTPLTGSWIHGQRSAHCYSLCIPVTETHANIASARFTLDTLKAFAKRATLLGVYGEKAGLRSLCHWVPLLARKTILQRVGGWPITDEAAMSFDIVLDNALGHADVAKRMPLDHHIFRMKHYLKIDGATDNRWADPSILETTKSATLL